MKKRLLTFTLAAVMILSLLTACTANDSKETTAKPDSNQTEETPSSEKSQNKELVDVTLNEVAHSIFYAPMYAAIENGYFESEGINLYSFPSITTISFAAITPSDFR